MKFLIIPYIALGLVLSLAIGIIYDCEGQEMFPEYYGSPFVFKLESLGSSMEYYYSISGLVLNVLVWSLLLLVINQGIQKLMLKVSERKWMTVSYKTVTVLMIAFATLNIAGGYVMLGRGFGERLNYWYFDIDKEAKERGMKCKGELMFFTK